MGVMVRYLDILMLASHSSTELNWVRSGASGANGLQACQTEGRDMYAFRISVYGSLEGEIGS